MATLALVNPRRRGGKKKTRRVATKRKTTTAAARRRRNPAKRPAARRAAPKRRMTRRRRNPSARGIVGQVKTSGIKAVHGAAGAIGVDVLLGQVGGMLPDSIRMGGPARYLVKGIAAFGLGILGKKIVKGPMAENMAVGGMTVALHEAAREVMMKNIPSVKLGESYPDLDYMGGYLEEETDPALSEFIPDDTMMLDGMGEFISDEFDELGWVNPGEVIS